jgi:methylmalonyl-CoA mutase
LRRWQLINSAVYIKANALEKKLRQKLKRFIKKGVPRPVYNGDLPAGNDGLGLYLLGVTGDHLRMFIMK